MSETSKACLSEPIVISGFGLVSSLGLDTSSTWEAVCQSCDGIRPLKHLEQLPEPDRGGGEAPDADLQGLSREAGYLRLAVHEAWAAAGLSRLAPESAARRALVMGTTLHGMRAAGRFFRSENGEDLKDFLAPAVLEHAAGDLGIGGPMLTTCAACSSGLTSVAMACTLLRSGRFDAVICGGYDPISEYAYAGFGSLRLIAEGPARPFCAQRDGLKLGEGYGALVLERHSSAVQRGAKIQAVVRGYGETSDAHHLTQPHPEGRGAAQAIQDALHQAECTADRIGLISAHATATPDNDRGECRALQAAFSGSLSRIPIVSFKSHLGHTLGGAGAVELILSIQAMQSGCIPPTRNVTRSDLEFPQLHVVLDGPEKAAVSHALNLSLGFGGANTAVVLGRSDQVPAQAGPVHSEEDQVWITGIGTLLPGLTGAEAFAAHLHRQDADAAPVPAGDVSDQAIESLLQARRVRRMSQYVKLSVAATHLAAQMSGLVPQSAEAGACAAILASMHGSARYSGDYYRQIVQEGLGAANPMLFAEGVPNAAAAHLSMMMGLRRGCQSLIGSRTGGLDAIGLSAERIRTGEWTRSIVSCAEENAPLVRLAYGHCRLLRENGNPTRAFDDQATGFVMSDGAVTMVLESRKSAERRGVRCLGMVRGWSSRSAPAHDLKRQVMNCAGLIEELGAADGLMVSANGTWMDRIEAAALQRLGLKIPVSSMAGHAAEIFSATPLAAAAAVLLTGRLPVFLGHQPAGTAWRGATGSEQPRMIQVISSDYQGLVSGIRLEIPST